MLLLLVLSALALNPVPAPLPFSNTLPFAQIGENSCEIDPSSPALVLLFDTLRDVAIVFSSSVNGSVFLQSADSSSNCTEYFDSFPLTLPVTPNVQHRLFLIPSDPSQTSATVSIVAADQSFVDTQRIYITELPWTRTEIIEPDVESQKIEDFDDGLIGKDYFLNITGNFRVKVDTCLDAGGLLGFQVAEDNKALASLDSYDMRGTENYEACASGLGINQAFDFHESSDPERYHLLLGFLFASNQTRSYTVRVTLDGEIDDEPATWEMWLWIGVVIAVILVFTLIVVVVLGVYLFIKRRRAQKTEYNQIDS